jgi:uncharacterized protein (DUF2252 family)
VAALALVASRAPAHLSTPHLLVLARLGLLGNVPLDGGFETLYGNGGSWEPPPVARRCEWVVEKVVEKNRGKSEEALRVQYAKQASDVNTFYRGTAYMFWADFVSNGWGLFNMSKMGVPMTLADGTHLQRTSTWTWVTGDQHLSNFGAWKNRNGEVIFGVNDFDEAVVYDFQIDVWRCAVSMYDHAISSGLDESRAKAAVLTFTDEYVSTLQGYLGNEKATVFEMTHQRASGKLAAFLKQIGTKQSEHKMLSKYTAFDENGNRYFVKNARTHLVPVSAQVEDELRLAFGHDKYGATMQHIGWHEKEWSDEYFRVLDVAQKVGSGVGSFGVARYYVLLAGAGHGVILDVKFEPEAAVAKVIGPHDRAWYDRQFADEASRAVKAQRALTSYTDPFTGVVYINHSAYVVRQRSPWKAGFDLSELQTYADLAEYVQNIAVITATSHARGTIGRSPGQFKEVIATALGEPYARATWGIAVSNIASMYREQVLLDFDCFKAFVEANYSR